MKMRQEEMLKQAVMGKNSRYKNKTLIDFNKWCGQIVLVSHATAILMVLSHIVWYFAARSILAWPPDVYLRDYIVLPAIGFFILNTVVDRCVRSPHIPLPVKEYLSLSLFIISSLYLSLTHDIAKVLLCSYILPIFASTIFLNTKLTRRIFLMSIIAVLMISVKMYYTGRLDNDMVMEIFVACFMFFCSYILAKMLIQYSQNNLTALIKSTEEAINNELAFLQVQIKPHFLYNAINTIISFCYTDSEKAASLLVNLSKYLRLLFDFDHKLMRVSLQRELEMIKAYVAIEKARFGDLIHVEYDIDPKLLSMEIPSFCIQPLVENAVKHGLCKKDAGGSILISAKRLDETVIITVRDTGAGMSAEILNKLKNVDSTNEGVGFFSVNRRIMGWRDAEVDIQSAPDEGTSVIIKIADGITKEVSNIC